MSVSDDMELREDRLAEAYKDWLMREEGLMLLVDLRGAAMNNPIPLDSLERKAVIKMILDRDATGKYNPNFEDVRNGIK